MKQVGQSIQNSILLIVTTSLLVLAVTLVMALSRHEMQKVRKNTRLLVHEQIGLTVSRLDVYRLLNQVSYILKVVFKLDRVDGVNIFDRNCELIGKQPINFKIDWDCKSDLPDSMVLYESNTSISYSNGAPKYVLASLKESPDLFIKSGIFDVLLILIALILITILCLNFFIKRGILKPIADLHRAFGKPGALKRDNEKQRLLPSELRGIYDNVLFRDEIIQQNKIQLLKQREIEIKGQMSQQIAHDIRSPIMVLKNYYSNDVKGKKQNHILFKALDDLDLLVNQLFEQSSDYTEEIDLVGLIREVIEMKRIEFNTDFQKVRLSFDPGCELARVKVNPTKIKFILSNIMNNAKEASGKNDSFEIKVYLRVVRNHVIIDVTDHGIGIKEVDLPRVFDRGFSINKPGGSGLGLFDAKTFFERERGTITIQSECRRGTTVTMTLPAISEVGDNNENIAL